MSSYDDWVVNFKVNTKPIDDALKKVNKLNQAISNLYGGGSGGGRGSGRGGSSTSSGDNPRRRRMTRTAEERAEIGAYQQDARRTRDLSRAEIQAYNEQERRVRAQNTAARRLAQAEIAAHNEDARRTRDVNRAASNAQSARDTLNRGEQLRRRGINQRRDLEMYNRAGAERNRISGIQQRRDMEMYNRSGTERNRINSIQQMRQYQQAVEAAAERRRIAEIQQRRDMEQYNSANAQRRFAEIQGNRATRLSSARESRNYTLNSLEQRARQAGASIDQTQLGSLRQRISGASNFTQLGTLSAEMRAFRDVTNAAIARQNALNRQMQQSGFAATAFTNSMRNLAASMLGVYAIGNTMTNMYNRAKELQSNQSKLIMGTGSKTEAARAFGKIKGMAQETGLGINQVTDLYGKLAINAKDSGMSEQGVDSIFRAVTTMMVGYGLDENQQKLVTKAFSQMLSKQRVGAEEFANQLGDQAPGIMSGLAQAEGLSGPGAQKELRKRMEKGEIGIDTLIKFTNIMKEKAIATGAYGDRISSIQAAETRMNNAFSYFSNSLVVQLDESIKSTFGDVKGILDRLAEYFDKQEKMQKETGEVGTFKTIMDYIWLVVKDVGKLLMLGAEGFLNFFTLLPGGKEFAQQAQGYMAYRQLEEGYFESKGAKTPMEQLKLRGEGMVGFEDYKRNQFKLINPSGTEEQYKEFSRIVSSGGTQTIPGVFAGAGSTIGQLAGAANNNGIFDQFFDWRSGGALGGAISALASTMGELIEKYNKLDAVVNPAQSISPGAITINIDGSKDPIATGKAVQNELNQLLIYPR